MSAVEALCLVVFDVDVGQQVEAVHPAGALTAQEASDVAFHSFPDSMSMELRSKSSVRDSSFFFRINRRGQQPPGAAQFLYGFVFCRQRQDERLRRGGEQKSVVVLSALPLSSVLGPLSRFLGPMVLSYGQDVLRQVYEEVLCWPPPAWGVPMTLPLGDVGTITARLPELSTLPGLTTPAAPACRSPPSSPPPRNSSRASSPLPAGKGTFSPPNAPAASGSCSPGRLGVEEGLQEGPAGGGSSGIGEGLLAELDEQMGLPLCLLPQAYGQQELVQGPFAEVDAYTPLQHVLQQLWALWEVLVLGEPLMVAAPTPAACSGAVAALLSLLAPLPYAPDFRPYLTIHDPSFAGLAAGALPGPGSSLPSLLGVTNLYFVKALSAWPNVLSTGYAAQQQQQQAAGGGSEPTGEDSGRGGDSSAFRRSESAQSVSSSIGNSGGSGAGSRIGQALRQRTQGPQALLSGATDALWLAYKPCTRPDKQVLSRLTAPRPTEPPAKVERCAQLNTLILRRHFQELTQALLFPMLPYITPAPPPTATPSPSDLQRPPPLPPLDPAAILENLGAKSGTIPEILLQRFGGNKGLVQFYQRFLESSNLQSWLQTRRVVAEQWQAQAWHEAWWEAGGVLNQPGAHHMQEVVAVEEFFELEQRLAAAEAVGQPPEELDLLLARLRELFAAMPPDLQQSLLLSQRRASWLT